MQREAQMIMVLISLVGLSLAKDPILELDKQNENLWHQIQLQKEKDSLKVIQSELNDIQKKVALQKKENEILKSENDKILKEIEDQKNL